MNTKRFAPIDFILKDLDFLLFEISFMASLFAHSPLLCLEFDFSLNLRVNHARVEFQSTRNDF